MSNSGLNRGFLIYTCRKRDHTKEVWLSLTKECFIYVAYLLIYGLAKEPYACRVYPMILGYVHYISFIGLSLCLPSSRRVMRHYTGPNVLCYVMSTPLFFSSVGK